MKTRILIYALVAFFAVGCSDPCDDPVNLECLTGDADGDGVINPDDTAPLDPCVPADNLACPTGDLDNDGIANADDSDPEERCLPNVPPVILNAVGNWAWGSTGEIAFLEDGTFQSVEGQFLTFTSGAEIVGRSWTAQGNTLSLTITNEAGGSATADYDVIANECNSFTIMRNTFELRFTRL